MAANKPTPEDPCAALTEALHALRACLGEPTTRKEIAAWNKAEEALAEAREALRVRDAGHTPFDPNT